jgi:hypothetical protein
MASSSKVSMLVISALALCLIAAVAKLATAAQDKSELGGLNANEGIFVDPKTFNIVKGSAKTDPSAQIVKLGAREVTNGAIIFRAGDKLYLVDANPAEKSLINAFWDDYDQFHN